MAKVLPFKGLRYSDKHCKDIEKLVTPPYDIISPKEQQRFYRSHANNIIRLELGKIKPTDNEKNNRYTRARKTVYEWLAQNVLTVESKPSFYLMQSEYQDPSGEVKKVTALFAYVGLEQLNEGKILPHEKTYEGPKADRYNLLKETGVSFSPVYSLYRDPSGKVTGLLAKVMKRKPKMDFNDWADCNHKLWVINKPAELEAIQQGFQGKKLLIADGHHRYSTALNYQKTYGKEVGPNADQVMMCLTETNDEGLSVLPVYRLIKGISQKQWKSFERELHEVFDVEKIGTPKDLQAAQIQAVKATKNPVIGYIGNGGKEAFLLKIKKESLDVFINSRSSGHSRIYYRLDVVLLNQLILETLLGIQQGEEKERLSYTKNIKDALNTVKKGDAQAAFLPGLPNLNAIWDLAKKGETMPQKSTYFLPKLITGMVMNPINLDEELI